MQQNPYGGIVKGQVRRNLVRDNRESENQRQQARQDADVPQVEQEVTVSQSTKTRCKATITSSSYMYCNVGVQADNNYIYDEDFMQETIPISCNYT
ncbi:Hypothetical predicted protein [Mytilus galloprovincialis]|uniref:Uncharacterized protein n=1 Tax=Mytilus galloprovincialis TaxID=29158 RepID=A0A8B6HI78_MYTGA|nr:Hypothetical predicted protein [Mytilus galloprovincialis]